MAAKGLSIGVSSYALVAASALLIAVKVWGGAPIPWWAVLLPLWLLCALAVVTLLMFGAIAALGALVAWLRRH